MFRLQRRAHQMFKTAHHDRFVHDFRVAAVDVALATSAAPTYFSAFNTAEGQSFLDGGVWANCPVMVGLLEAMYVLNIPPEDVHILSLGTTDDPSMFLESSESAACFHGERLQSH